MNSCDSIEILYLSCFVYDKAEAYNLWRSCTSCRLFGSYCTLCEWFSVCSGAVVINTGWSDQIKKQITWNSWVKWEKHKNLSRTYEWKRPLEISMRKWDDNIKMNLREIRYNIIDGIHLVRVMNQWQILVKTVINLTVP